MVENRAWHYNKATLVNALLAAGVQKGDVIFSHVSLGRLGYPEEGSDTETACKVLHEAFIEVLGDQGTLLVPTYTYSIGKGEVYDIQDTPSTVGPYTEYFRKLPGAVRSRDPMLAVTGMGPKAEDLLTDLPKTCYGEGSLYHRMRKIGARICNVGISLYWATFRHHIEEVANVPFRFKKLFTGYICDKGVMSYERWIYFAAPLVTNCNPDGMKLDRKARLIGLCKSVSIGRSKIICIDSQEYFELGLDELSRDPWLTAKGPPCNLKQLVQLEKDRVSGHRYEVKLNPYASMKEIIDKLWYLPRDMISDGYDVALEELEKQVPMVIHEFPTGMECGTKIVPEKWTCHEAYLETISGECILSYEDNLLHVASYSQPFSGVISREELFQHLTVHPVLPDAIPFNNLYNKCNWGLCCSQKTKLMLTDEFYRVIIKTDFSYSTLKVGEITAKGQSSKCIVLCTHLDHPGQANDGLSGVAVGIDIMTRLLKIDNLRYTYRSLFVPETIGLLAYLSNNEDLVSYIDGVFFLDMLGLEKPHSLRTLLQCTTDVAQYFALALQEYDSKVCIRESQALMGNDSQQLKTFDASVPVLSLSRELPSYISDYPYLEHHSSQDMPEIVSAECLESSLNLVLRMIDVMECKCNVGQRGQER